MSKVRSPNFPGIDLGKALALARKAFDKDHRNKISRTVLAKHVGHETLSGPALTKIGALRAYGLVEGAGDEMRISDDAVTAMMAPPDGPDRAQALSRLAIRPGLFKEIQRDYPNNHPSEESLRYWLVKRHFTPDAAAKAAKTYLATMQLAGGVTSAYSEEEAEDETDMATVEGMPQNVGEDSRAPATFRVGQGGPFEARQPEGTRREVITLDEGDVVITFPDDLSADSFGDLKDHLDLFIKKMQRRAGRIDS